VQDLEEHLKGKNPKRVLGQINAKKTRTKKLVLGYFLCSILLTTLGIGGFFIEAIPTWLKWTSLALSPFQLLGLFAESMQLRLLSKQASYIETTHLAKQQNET